MLTIGCVLKTGGPDFDWEYVRVLRDSLARNIPKETAWLFGALTDFGPGRDAGQDAIWDGLLSRSPNFQKTNFQRLRHDLPGWWSKMELFSPEVRKAWGDTLYFDLDTAITGDLTPIIDYCQRDYRDPTQGTPFTVLRDFYRPYGYGSGMMFIPAGFGANVWTKFMASDAMSRLAGDQNFLEETCPIANRWQDVVPNAVKSFKPSGFELAAVTPATRVVCFHGFPRPHQLPKDHFMRRYWRANPVVVASNERPLNATERDYWNERYGTNEPGHNWGSI